MGYRHSDGVMPELVDVDPSAKFTLLSNFTDSERTIVGVCVGPPVYGVACPHADMQAPDNGLSGAMKRMIVKPLVCDLAKLDSLGLYALEFCRANFQPLSFDQIPDFYDWIKDRPYPEARKAELTRIYEDVASLSIPEVSKVVKCFIKDETYSEFKFARGIYARSDVFKVLFGPLVSAIEAVVFKHPAFIKKVPVDKRPDYIMDLLCDEVGQKFATDISSMEASFTPEVMAKTDNVLFHYFCDPIQNYMAEGLYNVPAGLNRCVFKWFMMYVKARRMSGEMNTSLCNGFANIVTLSYLCETKGCGKPRAVVEGDDGLFVTPTGKVPSVQDYLEIGFRCKLERHNSYATASFCGLIFDPEDRVIVRDPYQTLVDFGWAGQSYVKSNLSRRLKLLRCKSLSFLHQYYGCPVIQELALYGLRMTKSFDVKHFVQNERSFSTYERERLLHTLESSKHIDLTKGRTVPINTRLLMEEKYGLSVEMQLLLEDMLRNKNDFEPFILDYLDFPNDWIRYGTRFVMDDSAPIVPQSPIRYGELFKRLSRGQFRRS